MGCSARFRFVRSSFGLGPKGRQPALELVICLLDIAAPILRTPCGVETSLGLSTPQPALSDTQRVKSVLKTPH